MKGGVEATEFSSTSFAGGWGDILGGASGASEHLCYPCKTSDYHAKRHTASTKDQGRLPTKKPIKMKVVKKRIYFKTKG